MPLHFGRLQSSNIAISSAFFPYLTHNQTTNPTKKRNFVQKQNKRERIHHETIEETRGVHVTCLPDQIEKPARIDRLAARSDDSSGQRRVSTLQTRFRRVEWRVFYSKTATTRPARPPLQMKASSVKSGNN